MILFDHVTKHYHGDSRPALDNISMHIAANEFVFLVGKSGAGKSTLLKMITKEEIPDSGKIVIGGILGVIVNKSIYPIYRGGRGGFLRPFNYRPQGPVS
ncbi:ATP-binding cassette domain-containing protein, partial [Candidatus Saccharibacteria bacterium]|nr:ATP-binding cassette domain-containing protein [Candidatus Saccharibacteria bacterium]